MVWGACLCARSVERLLPEHDPRPERAIRTAEAWVLGTAGARLCRERSEAAHQAAFAAYSAGGRAAANAAHAAGHAAGTVSVALDGFRAADAAATAVGNTAARQWREARQRHLAALGEEIAAVPWPLTVPTVAEVLAAPPSVQVAWDRIAGEPRPDPTLAGLLEAHARAGRLGLDWRDPVQRAIAERTVDEAAARALLRLGP